MLIAALPHATAPAPYASLRGPGPALTAPAAARRAALHCASDLRTAARTPVLLVSGTGVGPEQLFGGTWMPALTQQGIPYCSVELPYRGLGDIQLAGEYVVSGIRAMYAAYGRRISVVGASQGGIVPRWALRFWPDTRRMVDDVIGLAPTNHGVPAGDIVARCAPTGCPRASMQQAAGSAFLGALNSRAETFAGVSSTQIRSRTDELIGSGDVPAARASESLSGPGRIANVATQDRCPGDRSSHVATGTTSNAAWALALDALTHDGPADPGRVPAATCAVAVMPGVALARPPAPVPELDPPAPLVRREPALRRYVLERRRPRVVVSPSRLRAGRLTRVRVVVRTAGGDPLPGQRVAALRRTARTDAAGRVVLRLRAPRRGTVRVRVSGNGLPARTVVLRIR